ncbi:uncharacterized protein LOC115069418 isoform X1 [Nannospalax galili]|uniref:uncharacterized protein LOC115069418 isoform X1 n=1 Tax=Nannospalax galili TaxID=1026970 RepID=UPI00111C0ED2|nr:uncharacterized protein LOC115069418 isoform X1 [Nannospalax galili]XP_029416865.1 uncharacterized protein LOC115069418 isoform X1 [Nannospalax galili]XP_029416866.1 uncharacterized protein LOC115069418 isoform X1 [Nannospalax galili]
MQIGLATTSAVGSPHGGAAQGPPESSEPPAPNAPAPQSGLRAPETLLPLRSAPRPGLGIPRPSAAPPAWLQRRHAIAFQDSAPKSARDGAVGADRVGGPGRWESGRCAGQVPPLGAPGTRGVACPELRHSALLAPWRSCAKSLRPEGGIPGSHCQPSAQLSVFAGPPHATIGTGMGAFPSTPDRLGRDALPALRWLIEPELLAFVRPRGTATQPACGFRVHSRSGSCGSRFAPTRAGRIPAEPTLGDARRPGSA